MATKWTCTNCLWSGTFEDMEDNGDGAKSCPDCCAIFDTEGDVLGPWEAEVIDDDPDEDYGDFDDYLY